MPNFPFRLSGVKTRSDFPRFLHERNLLGTAVEVGVDRGNFSQVLLKKWLGKKLVLVDPWKILDNYDDVVNSGDRQQVYASVVRRLKPYGDRVSIIRGTSEEVAPRVNPPLDFVYIDGNHAYEYAKQDISLWWPKIRSGGILAGHDLFFLGKIGVTNAIIEFALAHNLTAYIVNDSPRTLHSWYFEKP